MTQIFCSDSRRIQGRIVSLRNLGYNEEAGQKSKSDGTNLYFRGPNIPPITAIVVATTMLHLCPYT
jgi:hypothetical protein